MEPPSLWNVCGDSFLFSCHLCYFRAGVDCWGRVGYVGQVWKASLSGFAACHVTLINIAFWFHHPALVWEVSLAITAGKLLCLLWEALEIVPTVSPEIGYAKFQHFRLKFHGF